MDKRRLTCIGCPLGCQLEVALDGESVVSVTGNNCKQGDRYARKEVTAPSRIVTSTVRVSGSRSGAARVSCKTASDVPKEKMFDVIADIRNVVVRCPVMIGDVVKENVGGTGIDMVATKRVE